MLGRHLAATALLFLSAGAAWAVGGETFATATPIPFTPGGTWSESASTAAAQNDYDSNVAALYCQVDTHNTTSFGGRDVLYSFTLGSSTTVSVDLCTTSNWNCVTGIARGDGTLLSACNDNTTLCAPSTTRSTIPGCCLSPGTYFVVVDGYGGATVGGPYTLSVGFGAEACSSACDLYADQTLALVAPGTVTGSTVGAPQVHGTTAGDAGISVVIPAAGEWNFDTCDAATSYAADLYLFTAPPCEGGQLIASNTSGTCASMAGTGRLLNVGLQAGSYHLMVSHTALLEGSFGLSVTATSPARASQGGPDTYGYLWSNSLDAAGPVFDWVDIRSVGTPVVFASGASTAGPFNLGMDFPFYDSIFSQCTLSSDGFLSFEALASSYGANAAIPTVALPNAVVAPFWDDLAFTAGVGQAYTWFDSANRRFIVSWVNFTKTAEPVTFQLILQENGDILFQYLTMPVLLLNSASAGIEDTGGARGLRLSLNNVGGALYAGVASRLVRPTDMEGPAIAHTPLVDTPQVGPWTVEALLEDPSGVAGASLSYRVEGGAWSSVALVPGEGGSWSAQIPALHGTVDYFLTASDGASPPRSRTSPTWSFVARPTRGGPDSYGYTWTSSRDASGPPPQWVDISVVGTLVAIANNSSAGPIELGMAFPHYDATHTSCVLSSEGFLCFAAYTGFQNINYPMPSVAMPHGTVAAFWDDLSMGAGSQLRVWADSTGGRFIASWLNFLKGTTPLSFQVVLEEDGDVWANFLDLPEGQVNSATVGLENLAGNVGLQVNHTHTGALLADGVSLRLARPTDVTGPVITHTPLADTESFGPWPLLVQVEDPSGVASLTLQWRTDGGVWASVAGQDLGAGQWRVELPATSGQIQYFLSAVDGYSPAHTTTSPTWSFLRRHTQGGPDAFGHTWINGRDPLGPAFQWEDISTVGTPLSLTNLPYSDPIPLPFAFPFFDQVKNTVRVNCHGALEFSASISGASLLGQTPPNSATPNEFIAVYWAGLNARPSGGGMMWTWHDAATQRFIVQWRGHAVAGGPLVEVQAVLDEAGRIQIRLLQVDEAVLNGATLGMENATGSDGFTVHRYGAGSAVADSLAFLLSAPGPVIGHTPLTDTRLPGPYAVVATLTDPQGVGQATLEWRVDRGAWQNAALEAGGGTWTALIPDFTGVAEYRIHAVNALGLATTSPTWTFAHRPTQAAADSSGYAWINSHDAAGPAFQWVDISSTGTPMPLTGGHVSPPLALGFSMPYYESRVDSLRISGDGLLVLQLNWSWEIAYNRNLPLPEGSPNGIIAPLWDSFSSTSSSYPGMIWVKAEAGRFIVQFHMVAEGGRHFFDFQVLLHADGNIAFNYLQVDDADVASATVGVENLAGDRGLMVNRLNLGGAIADSLSVQVLYNDGIGPVATWLQVPDQTSLHPQTVAVDLQDLSGVSAAELWFRPAGGFAQSVPMAWEEGTRWSAQLPPQLEAVELELRVLAWDGVSPPNASSSPWQAFLLHAYDSCQEALPENHSAFYLSIPSDEGALATSGNWPIQAERFHAEAPIAAVNFRANHEVVSGGSWITCTLDTLWLAVDFRTLDGQLVRSQEARLVGTPSVAYPCSNCNDGLLPSWDYHLVLDTPLSLADGWLSLRGLGQAPCWLMWVFSQAGADGQSSRVQGGDVSDWIGLDLGYCLEIEQACSTPLELNALWTGEGCQLSWEAVPGASAYQVESAASAFGPFSPLGVPVAAPAYLDLTAGTQRCYRVRAICP